MRADYQQRGRRILSAAWVAGFACVLTLLGTAPAAAQPDFVAGACSSSSDPSSYTMDTGGETSTFSILYDWTPPPLDGSCTDPYCTESVKSAVCCASSGGVACEGSA